MSAVEWAGRSIDRHLHIGHTARAEIELHAAALMDRTVANHPDICSQIFRKAVEVLQEMR